MNVTPKNPQHDTTNFFLFMIWWTLFGAFFALASISNRLGELVDVLKSTGQQ